MSQLSNSQLFTLGIFFVFWVVSLRISHWTLKKLGGVCFSNLFGTVFWGGPCFLGFLKMTKATNLRAIFGFVGLIFGKQIGMYPWDGMRRFRPHHSPELAAVSLWVKKSRGTRNPVFCRGKGGKGGLKPGNLGGFTGECHSP